MSSIPLVATTVRPPQTSSPLEQAQKLLSLRDLLDQRQLHQTQLAGAQQNLDAGKIDLQQKQIQLKDQQAMSAAMADWDGKNIDDLPGLYTKHGVSAPTVLKTKSDILDYKSKLTTQSKEELANEKIKNDYFAQQIDNLRKLPEEQQPAAFEQAKAEAVQQGHMSAEQAQHLQYQGPQQLELLEKTLLGHAGATEWAIKTVDQQSKQAALDAQNAWIAQNPGKTAADYEVAQAGAKSKAEALGQAQGQQAAVDAGAPMTQAQADAKYRTVQMKISQNQPVTPDEKAFAASYEKQKTLNTQVQINAGSNLTDTARDQAAEKYWATGQLPPTARGVAGMRQSQAIMNRAAELHPTGSLAANSAEYKANEESLRKLQTNFDQVTAFENTAGKNLDVFLKTADKISDAGSKFINMPLRAISRGMLGTADMAAFDTARTTALTEISKVLNSSNAQGVLSDSARHEVEQLIGPNATLAGIKSAANILKQDMANRHESYATQIDDIKGRLGMPGGGGKTETEKPNQQTGQPKKVPTFAEWQAASK